MTLRPFASSGLYVSLLSALDLGRFVGGEPASPRERPRPGETDGDDFEDTLPAWVVSSTEDDSPPAA